MNISVRRVLQVSRMAVVPVLVTGLTAILGSQSVAGAAARVGATPVAAQVAATPPWEPDKTDEVGGLVFYNAEGQVITGGSLTDSPVAAYVEGTNTIVAGDTKATLFGYLPVKGQSPGQWSGEALGSSTTYPNPSYPSPLNTTGLPVEAGNSGDETIGQLEEDFPNTDSSDDGYADMYQLRLRTSAPDAGLSTTWDSADIMVNNTEGTWSVVYSQSPATPTKTSLSVSATKVTYGATLKLSASVSPAAATGSVEFRDGSKTLAKVTVSDGKAAYSTRDLAGGVQKLSAVFVPGSTSYGGSSSSVHKVTVGAHSTTTSLKASSSSVTEGAKVTLSATVSPAAAGKVTFYDGSKKLATVKVKDGKAAYETTKLPVGSDVLKAVFAASDSADYAASTSKTVTVKVAK